MYYQEKNIDDSSMPEVIYKYRTWKKDKHKRVITNKAIYFSSPLEMEEFHELFFDIDFSRIENKQMLYKYFYDTAPQQGYFAHAERDGIAKLMVDNYPNLTPEFKTNFYENFRKGLDEDSSVFCASEHKNNINLWNQFGGNHQGFCMGLNLKEISKLPRIASTIRKVEYSKDKPNVPVLTMNQLEFIEKYTTCLFSLNQMFSDEDELRLVKLFIAEKENVLPDNCFKELILGTKISGKDKSEILKIVEINFPGLPVEQAINDAGILKFNKIK